MRQFYDARREVLMQSVQLYLTQGQVRQVRRVDCSDPRQAPETRGPREKLEDVDGERDARRQDGATARETLCVAAAPALPHAEPKDRARQRVWPSAQQAGHHEKLR